jgi:hypothetical protein
MTHRAGSRHDAGPGMTVLHAEGARVGFVVCQMCGAAILLDPRELFDATKLHDEWHIDVDNRIAANRPDPRSGFIGG